jgi:trigger factor
VKSSTIDPPESMIEQEMEMKWRNMLYRFGANEQMLLKELQNQQKDKAKLLEEWRPAAEESIKSSLVVEEMVTREAIEITDEELDEEIKKIAADQKMEPAQMKENLTANGMLQSVKMNIRNQKLFTHLLKSTNIKKGKKFKYLDYIEGKNVKE